MASPWERGEKARRVHHLPAGHKGGIPATRPGSRQLRLPPRPGTHRPFRVYPFLGASPNFLPAFFMAASKFLRAFAQVLSLRGTAHSPIPLHVFSPGFSPQPPSPAQSLCPLQTCSLTEGPRAWPAQSFFFPLYAPLQVGFSPRQMCGSWRRSGFLGSFFLGLSSARARPAPATIPPRAAAASLVKSRRFMFNDSLYRGPESKRGRVFAAAPTHCYDLRLNSQSAVP